MAAINNVVWGTLRSFFKTTLPQVGKLPCFGWLMGGDVVIVIVIAIAIAIIIVIDDDKCCRLLGVDI